MLTGRHILAWSCAIERAQCSCSSFTKQHQQLFDPPHWQCETRRNAIKSKVAAACVRHDTQWKSTTNQRPRSSMKERGKVLPFLKIATRYSRHAVYFVWCIPLERASGWMPFALHTYGLNSALGSTRGDFSFYYRRSELEWSCHSPFHRRSYVKRRHCLRHRPTDSVTWALVAW